MINVPSCGGCWSLTASVQVDELICDTQIFVSYPREFSLHIILWILAKVTANLSMLRFWIIVGKFWWKRSFLAVLIILPLILTPSPTKRVSQCWSLSILVQSRILICDHLKLLVEIITCSKLIILVLALNLTRLILLTKVRRGLLLPIFWVVRINFSFYVRLVCFLALYMHFLVIRLTVLINLNCFWISRLF